MLFFFFISNLQYNAFANIQSQETQDEEAEPKKKVTLKEYSTGTVYKEVAPESGSTPTPQKSGSATNEDDPGFPGDPGQGLPVGDGLVFLLGTGFVYFLIKKYTLKRAI